MINSIIRNCDKCNKEDSINCVSGLCPSCEAENNLSKILNPNNKYKRTQKEILRSVFKDE